VEHFVLSASSPADQTTVMRTHLLRVAASSLGLALLVSQGAPAQTIDYGALAQLFKEPITTSATGSPQKSSETPVTLEIITADDIRRSGATDIPGVLRHVIGVDVMRWTNDNADVAVRGYNRPSSSRLLVLIDGRQVYADFYGYTPWTTLPVELSAIRQIEVVEGPNSALFGFNAVGGVINIVTYSPLYDNVDDVQLAGGTQGALLGSGVATVKLNSNAGFRLTLGGRKDDDFSTPLQNPDLGVRRGNSRVAVNLSGVAQVTERSQLSAEVTHSTASEPDMSEFLDLAWVQYQTHSGKVQLTADTPAGLMQGTVYSNWISAQFSAGANSAFVPFDNHVTVLQLQDIVTLGTAHTIRPSFEYRENTLSTGYIPGARIFYDVVAGGLMWDWKISPNVSLTNALRSDRLILGRSGPVAADSGFTDRSWDRTIKETSFNSGLVWRMSPRDTVRAIVARGIQLPNLSELGGLDVRMPGVRIMGVPTIDPTAILNYELAWDRTLQSINTDLRISAFHEKTTDITATEATRTLTPTGVLITPGDIGDSRANGAELSLRGTIGQSWRWGAGYRVEVIRDHINTDTSVSVSEVDFEHSTPVHVLNVNAGWNHGPWEADTFVHYESKTRNFDALGALVTIRANTSVDTRVAYRLKGGATLSVAAQNLVTSPQTQTSGPAVQRRILFSFSWSP
jgi:iron complex outermembrane receptor protein